MAQMNFKFVSLIAKQVEVVIHIIMMDSYIILTV